MNITTTPPNGEVIMVRTSPPVNVVVPVEDPINVITPIGLPGKKGDPGAPGKDAQWESMTQAEYNAILDKDPQTLYVIVP